MLDEHVPVFPGRAFHQTLVTTAHHANMGGVGENRVNWITEVISGTTQLGTHLDALSHLQIGDRAYNGRRVDDIASPAGVTALGDRDRAADRHARLPRRRVRPASSAAGGVIGLDDVAGIEPRARRRGALPHRLGRALGRRRARTSPASPGPGIELAEWLADARRRAHRLRHLELRPGAGRESRRGRSRCRRR